MERTVGSLLKQHRSSTGLTQEELAEQAEVSARTVSDVERGLRTRIYRDTALRLANALALGGDERAEFEAASRGRGQQQAQPASPFPAPPTRLIGRKRELDAVMAALEDPEVRLVTLTGPGGVGKTRLALDAAARAGTRDGKAFVQLATTSDRVEVIREIANAVGVSSARIPTPPIIAEHLAGRDTLVVLDTFEHVLDAAPDIADLISRCAGPTLLVTSREALRIRGEHEVSIPTLDVPRRTSIGEVLSSPATALFIERAHDVLPALEIDEAAAETLADICGRLSGLPLAIELAAARVKHLPLSTLRAQLEHSLDVLVAGPRDLPRRQRTMRDAIGWSYTLLDPSERRAFLDLSVFSGGWTLEAASAVCGNDVLDEISGLIDKSLVIRADDDGPRWDMLDVIHEFAAEMRQGDAAERRHLAYFASMAEEAERGLGGAEQEAWLRRLAREHDNIRAVLRRVLACGDAETALRIGGAIWRFWLLHGDLSEGRGWLGAALDLDPVADVHARAKAIWGLAWLAYHQGDLVIAEGCADELLRMAEAGGDQIEMRNALTICGIVDLAHRRFADAIVPLERSVELLRGAGVSWLLATSLLNLGQATMYARDPRAGSVLDEARGLYLELGDERFAARSDLYLGYAALLQSDADSALALFRETLITFWELDDVWGSVEALEGIAAIAAEREDGTRAVRIAGAADALRETVNTRPFPADHAVLERSLERLRPKIQDAIWAATWEAGRAMSLDDAVEEASQIG
jgi:predicted ATPase/transcriptional regulator with XRE-family HTH domain